MDKIEYEPTGFLAMDFSQNHTVNESTAKKVVVNGTSNGTTKTLDYKQALISQAPVPTSALRLGSGMSLSALINIVAFRFAFL